MPFGTVTVSKKQRRNSKMKIKMNTQGKTLEEGVEEFIKNCIGYIILMKTSDILREMPE